MADLFHSEQQHSRTPYAITLLCAVAVIGAMALAREVLLPFVLAVLVSFTLAPLADRLEKLRMKRVPAVILVSLVFFGIASVVGYVIVQQVYDFAVHLPDYKVNIINKARSFNSGQPGVIDRVTETFKDVTDNLTNQEVAIDPEIGPPAPEWLKHRSHRLTPPPVKKNESDVPKPIPVEIVEHVSTQDILTNIIGPVMGPIGSFGLLFLFVVFILLEREDLRNRLIRLAGPKRLTLTTEALDDAARRVSRYLVMQLAVNAYFGLMVALGLTVIGLPNAFLWGVLAFVLRFVPYIGPLIATCVPVVLSLAVFDGWRRPLMVFAWFISNELVINNFIEPWLYGVSTGISRIGVLASAVFWGWLWGPVGLVIATPLTVSLTVIGKYVPAFSFLMILLSDEEILPPRSRFYQRLLAMDPEEALEIADAYLKEYPLEQLYDDVVIPALTFAERECRRGLIDPAKRAAIEKTMREIIDTLGKREDDANEKLAAITDATGEEVPLSVLCLPAHDDADEIAAIMLVQLLQRRRCPAEVLSVKRLASEMIDDAARLAPKIICISSLPPFETNNASYLLKRVRPRFPEQHLVIGLWHSERDPAKIRNQLSIGPNDSLITTLAEAVDYIERVRTIAPAQSLSSAPNQSRVGKSA